MKIFDAHTTKEVDRLTIERQMIESVDLMERAAFEVFLWLVRCFGYDQRTFHVFCGVGNNGGDGLAVARMLHKSGFLVAVYEVAFSSQKSHDYQINELRLKEAGVELIRLQEQFEFLNIGKQDVIIDAIFGIGLTREPAEWVQQIIHLINKCSNTVIAIDVPSGMFLDQTTTLAVQADVVLTFEVPKLAFFIPDNQNYVKTFELLNIDWDQKALNEVDSLITYNDVNYIKTLYRPVSRFAHKGTQGHVLIIGGSYGKMGAVTLASKASLRAGCGLTTAFIPTCGYEILQTAVPEVMVITDQEVDKIRSIQFEVTPQAIGIGPGLGQDPQTAEALEVFLKQSKYPLVIDADALNLLASHPDWLQYLPQNTILTPHPKELERLIGPWNNDFEKLQKSTTFSKTHELILVLKGAYTLIVHGEYIFVNSTGNQALATGGSGDVLLGIITGLQAQGYEALAAAQMGVFLHGRTAELAMDEMTYESFIASDILHYLRTAFRELQD
jgi:ADP-dependent NAD(P)H-hydrate dehydratase / NAD(P)H-hydrate epimerase